MDGFDTGASTQQTPRMEDLKQFRDTSTEGAVFDASQYAFFGKDVVGEIELGGLEDEEDDLPAVGLDEEEFLFDREELNKDVSGPRGTGVISDRGSRESRLKLRAARTDDPHKRSTQKARRRKPKRRRF